MIAAGPLDRKDSFFLSNSTLETLFEVQNHRRWYWRKYSKFYMGSITVRVSNFDMV